MIKGPKVRTRSTLYIFERVTSHVWLVIKKLRNLEVAVKNAVYLKVIVVITERVHQLLSNLNQQTFLLNNHTKDDRLKVLFLITKMQIIIFNLRQVNGVNGRRYCSPSMCVCLCVCVQ